MHFKGTVSILAIILSTGAMTAVAKPTPGPQQPDVYDEVVQLGLDHEAIETQLNGIATDLDTVEGAMVRVSSELGMETGQSTHASGQYDNDVVTVGAQGDLARFTVSVFYYQQVVNDEVKVHVSLDGLTWSTLALLDPESGYDGGGTFVGHTGWTATVVARKIRISSYNDSDLDDGSVIAWAISAVGPADGYDMEIIE